MIPTENDCLPMVPAQLNPRPREDAYAEFALAVVRDAVNIVIGNANTIRIALDVSGRDLDPHSVQALRHETHYWLFREGEPGQDRCSALPLGRCCEIVSTQYRTDLTPEYIRAHVRRKLAERFPDQRWVIVNGQQVIAFDMAA